MPKVSVILPVYNAEEYIERSLLSLLNQSLRNIEIIIIDDGSTDNSLEIINNLVNSHPNNENSIHIISRENKGVAETRAEGVKLATGNYIIHLDSDDWVEKNWLECMYSKAIENDADIVICNYRLIYPEKNVDIYKPECTSNEEYLKSLLSGKVNNSNWDKLAKRSLYFENDINFISGFNMGEDFFVTLRLFFFSKKIISIPDVLYNYNQTNSNSLTATYSMRSLNDIVKITQKAEDFLAENGATLNYKEEFNKFKLNVRALFIIHSNGNKKTKMVGLELYPESNYLIKDSAPRILKMAFLLKRMHLFFLHRAIDYIYFSYSITKTIYRKITSSR